MFLFNAVWNRSYILSHDGRDNIHLYLQKRGCNVDVKDTQVTNRVNYETCNGNGHKYIMESAYRVLLTLPVFYTIFNDIPIHTHVYLNISYKEKDHAKRLGCRWDPLYKSWYCFDDNQQSINLWGKDSYKIPTSMIQIHQTHIFINIRIITMLTFSN